MHGLDVEADDVGLLLEVVVEEVAEVAEARVVADADDLALARLQLADEAAAGGGAAEVAGLDVDVDVVGLPQLVGELLEALAAAGDERDVVAALGQLAGHVGADAGGGAGDEDGRSVRGSGESHASIHTLVELWTHDRWRFPLPPRHRFPIDKYPLLRARVVADGIARADQIHETDPVPWPVLERVHDAGLLERIREGGLSVREERGLGLPWSPALVERGRRAVAGTLAAARHALERGVAMNLGGGTHHAGHAFARGYCLFNDVVAALGELRAEGLVERALVVDCDVHQGDGTADLLGPDPHAFTLSLHGARNYPFQRVPSDLDVDLASGTGDADYLEALDGALDVALRRCTPEIAFYLAGADPWEGDRLGRLALTKPGLRARDERVLDRLRGAGIPVCVVLAGGYAEDVRDTVDINAATAAVVAARQTTQPGHGSAVGTI